MSQYFQDFENKDEHDIAKCKEAMIEDIQNAMPTLIVLPFQAVRFSQRDKKEDIVKAMISSDTINKDTEWDGMDGGNCE